jgi:hypothetical protein
MFDINNDPGIMLNNVQNVQASVATDDDSSSTAGYIKNIVL